jgi:hypothetical protein
MAYDPAADLLYVGTGNGGPWNQNIRSPQAGDNLFLASIIAVNPVRNRHGQDEGHRQTSSPVGGPIPDTAVGQAEQQSADHRDARRERTSKPGNIDVHLIRPRRLAN